MLRNEKQTNHSQPVKTSRLPGIYFSPIYKHFPHQRPQLCQFHFLTGNSTTAFPPSSLPPRINISSTGLLKRRKDTEN